MSVGVASIVPKRGTNHRELRRERRPRALSRQGHRPRSRRGGRSGRRRTRTNGPLRACRPPTTCRSRRSTLIGRDDDLARIDDLLGQYRVVTLLGAGGVGKTRLALDAARRQLTRYPDGVWLRRARAARRRGARHLRVLHAVRRRRARRPLVARVAARRVARTAPAAGRRQLRASRRDRGAHDRRDRARCAAHSRAGDEPRTARRHGRGDVSRSAARDPAPERDAARGRCGRVLRRRAVRRARERRRRHVRAHRRERAADRARSAAGSTGSRWRSSSPPRACACSTSPRSPRCSTRAFACSAPTTAARCRTSRRCARRSTGATICSAAAERTLFARLAIFTGGFTLPAILDVCTDGELERRADFRLRSRRWSTSRWSCSRRRATGCWNRRASTRAERLDDERRTRDRRRAPRRLLPRAGRSRELGRRPGLVSRLDRAARSTSWTTCAPRSNGRCATDTIR